MSPLAPHIFCDDAEKKYCGTCTHYLPINNFWKCAKNWDGLQARCKMCLKVYANKNKNKIATTKRKYQEKHREKIQLKKRKYYEQNKDKIAESKKKYRRQNKEKCSLQNRNYRNKNKEKCLLYGKIYRDKNKEKVAEAKKKWYEKNKQRILLQRKKYYKKLKSSEEGRKKIHVNTTKARKKRVENGKIATYFKKRLRDDPLFAIKKRLRTSVSNWLKTKGGKKKMQTHKYLGCTYEKLMQHLRSQYVDGMKDENRGEWHVDHRVPLDAFDCLDDEQVSVVFYYKNLQPMWARENISKSNRYEEKDKVALIELFNRDHGTNFMSAYLVKSVLNGIISNLT